MTSSKIHTYDARKYANRNMTDGERVWWIFVNIVGLGVPFTIKMIQKRAALEAQFVLLAELDARGMLTAHGVGGQS